MNNEKRLYVSLPKTNARTDMENIRKIQSQLNCTVFDDRIPTRYPELQKRVTNRIREALNNPNKLSLIFF